MSQGLVTLLSSERGYRWLSALLLSCFILVAGFTVADYGMGWDEPTRWRSGDAKVGYYQELFASDQPLEVARSVGLDRYPGLFDMSLSLAHQWTGWDRFSLGHYWSLGFGLMGLAGLWFAASRLGGAQLAFWSVLFLILTPPFYGHLFHNPKDIPFAAMYMVALWALVRFTGALPAIRWHHIFPLGIAVGLALSVRIAGLVLLGYYACLVALYFLKKWAAYDTRMGWHGFRNAVSAQWKPVLKLSAFGVASAALALLVLLVWWPRGQQNVFVASGDTFKNLHVSASEIPLFFRGQFLEAGESPFYYALWMMLIKSPESLLLLLAVALAAVIPQVRTGLRGILANLSLPWMVILLGALFPLGYLTVTAPALHNGARHFLFVFPPLCLLAAYGWGWLLERYPRHGSSRLGWVVRLLIPGLLLVQAFQMTMLHPYQYVYYNALIGGPAGSYARYETEYWFTSTKHGIEWLEDYLKDASIETPWKLFIPGPRQVAEPFLPDSLELTTDRKDADYFLVNTQMLMDQRIEGEDLFVIERMGLPILYIREPLSPQSGID